MQSVAGTQVGTLPKRAIESCYVVYLGVLSMVTFLSTVFVAIRFVSRRLTLSIAWDDWTCLAALSLSYGFLITTTVIATDRNAGYPLQQLRPAELEPFYLSCLANYLLYHGSVSLTKISILFFLNRLFMHEKFSTLAGTVGVLAMGYWLAATFGHIFAFSPVEAQWKPWLPHTNIDIQAFWVSLATCNTLLDFIILCLPQPMVWKLQMSKQQKLLLTMLFLLGSFVCIVSIFRIVSLSTKNLTDLDNSTIPAIWTVVEMNTGIICACLPMFPSLVRHLKDRRNATTSQSFNAEPLPPREIPNRRPSKGIRLQNSRERLFTDTEYTLEYAFQESTLTGKKACRVT